MPYTPLVVLLFQVKYLYGSVNIRVEGGSDNLDYLGHLGHFFGESSGSHPQTKLSGFDPDF